MNNSGFFGNVRLTVLLGYFVLFILAAFGLLRMYQELISFSKYQNPYSERKELSLVSNALVSLYEAESMRKVMLSGDLYTPTLQAPYKTHSNNVKRYIDSLYNLSDDKFLRQSLDTINFLLAEKDNNLQSMLLLMDSIRKLPYSKAMTTTILSKKDVNNLSQILNEKITTKQDTSYYLKERKSFMDRVRAVFSSKQDSTKVITTKDISLKDSSFLAPSDLLTDTIMQYINDVNVKSDRKKIAYMTKLAYRQNTMLLYDELLTAQINEILHEIEAKEKEIAIRLANEKQSVLQKSSKIVSVIGIGSMLVMIAFMIMSLSLINKSENFRKKLEVSKKFAEDLLKSRERLLLMISHDIKSPLSSIIGHIELLSKEKMPEDDRQHLNSMRNSSEQILELSNKLMDYHRLEQGKSELNLMPFSPHRLMEDIHQSLLPVAAKKGLYLKSKNDIDPSLIYESDPFVIKQIVNNLINNAIKFTLQGGVKISTLISKFNDELLISVEDTGVGIKEEDKERIFKDFERAGSAEMKQNVDGYGLGLAITSKLIESLSGKITFTSEFGKGTTFKISIPLKKTDEPIVTSGSSNVDINKKDISARILLVDDDVSILNVYSKLLERKGAVVSTCSDSSEVILLLQNKDFDIIFTDIQMPRINGFELVQNIRNLQGKYLDIPVIALSARSDVSEKDFRSAGFTTFITKPVPFDVMINIIRQIESGQEKENEDENEPENKGIHSLIEFVQDDPETSRDILMTFVEDNNNKLLEIKAALKTDDWNTIKSNAHKMLPLMRMMGEDEVVSVLEKLEAGEQDIAATEMLVTKVENKNQDILDYIEQKFS